MIKNKLLLILLSSGVNAAELEDAVSSVNSAELEGSMSCLSISEPKSTFSLWNELDKEIKEMTVQQLLSKNLRTLQLVNRDTRRLPYKVFREEYIRPIKVTFMDDKYHLQRGLPLREVEISFTGNDHEIRVFHSRNRKCRPTKPKEYEAKENFKMSFLKQKFPIKIGTHKIYDVPDPETIAECNFIPLRLLDRDSFYAKDKESKKYPLQEIWIGLGEIRFIYSYKPYLRNKVPNSEL